MILSPDLDQVVKSECWSLALCVCVYVCVCVCECVCVYVCMCVSVGVWHCVCVCGVCGVVPLCLWLMSPGLQIAVRGNLRRLFNVPVETFLIRIFQPVLAAGTV